MRLAKPLLERLLLARLFYYRGQDALRESGPFAAGFAICNFQDATETFLRVLAEHFHCSLKENTSFQVLLDKIDEVASESLTHRSSLIRLNKARINFKHFSLRPDLDDANKFMVSLEAFFATSAQRILGVDFGSVSMISLVEHTRTENWLRKAEQAIIDRNAREAIQAAAIAFRVFRRFLSPEYRDFQLDPFQRYENPDVIELSRSTAEVLDVLQEQLNLIMDGVDLAEFRRFQSIVPVVDLSEAGTVHMHWPSGPHVEPTIENAHSCIRFVIESALRIKQNYVKPKWTRQPELGKKLRVIEVTPIVVYPEDSPEVIREAIVGEILFSYKLRREHRAHVAVLQGGERAYISAKSIEEVNTE